MSEQKKIGIALTKEICIVCGKEQNGPILMNTVLSTFEAKKVEDLHNKVIGYSEKPCEDCQNMMNMGIVVVGIVSNLTTDEKNPYRSGHISVVKEKVFQENEEVLKKRIIFMDYEFGLQRGFFQINENEGVL